MEAGVGATAADDDERTAEEGAETGEGEGEVEGALGGVAPLLVAEVVVVVMEEDENVERAAVVLVGDVPRLLCFS